MCHIGYGIGSYKSLKKNWIIVFANESRKGGVVNFKMRDCGISLFEKFIRYKMS
jgi:hypothetical protein